MPEPPFSILLPSFRTTVIVKTLRPDELKAVLADLDLVAVPQIDRVDAYPIDVGTVEAARVPYALALLLCAAVVAAEDFRVLPGHGHGVEEDIALGAAPDRDDVLADVVHPTARGALDLV